ncbi:hypothetical protein SASPL_107321 [Salvia splendens]|uniref:non-specific serine/threonine protein kinase n=1 Tax=Salvia splendens TaxID=180675 RepID=A0A8X8YAW8_SALSN|nr:hypothetical protein SASPL_107321 [Salvia splendens]
METHSSSICYGVPITRRRRANNKYCYTLTTEERRRYIVRATFLYGASMSQGAYPKFQLYLDATKWSTMTVMDASRVYVKEMIIRAPSHSVDVCVCCATTGSPFISTLEMRPLNLSMYATDFEDNFYLDVAARVNFGAPTQEAIRYPDDPYDRIWESDLDRRPNFLVGVAPGTERINTTRDINVNTREYPPVKVMQTAVIGTKGSLSYRLNLEDFPAHARAYAYFAEIQDLGSNETRKFKMEQPYNPDYSNAVVNIAENANASYTLYEPSYMNVSLDFVLTFAFVKTRDSTQGPILNAMEISRYLEVTAKTDAKDVSSLSVLRAMFVQTEWAREGGDPCIPTSWGWVSCSSTAPPRISKIVLSGKNMTGEIPRELKNLEALTELWLDGNSFTGTIPDMSGLVNLQILHLENNQLTGSLPSYLGNLPYLQQLNVQNNSLSGEIPQSLLRENLTLRYEGNLHLRHVTKKHNKIILGITIGVIALLLVLSITSILLLRHYRAKKISQRNEKGNSWRGSSKPLTAYSMARGGSLMDEGVAYYIPLPDIEAATNHFSRNIGKGSFGPVYYGKLKDGKEVAVKIMADASSHGTKQFVTEVALLSRIHHRNLVPLIGYCEEEHRCMLVYEYMHNGTLRDHIHGSDNQKHLDWLARLRVAEDAAKETDNKLCITRYYANQQLTEKSDVYSFGVVMLELISGRKPVSIEEYSSDWSIVHWARSLIRKGDVISIIDPALAGTVKVESVWRIAEAAIQCVEQHSSVRPRMQEIILAIQDAVKIEKGTDKLDSSGSTRGQSSRKTLLTSFLDIQSPDISNGLFPSAR